MFDSRTSRNIKIKSAHRVFLVHFCRRSGLSSPLPFTKVAPRRNILSRRREVNNAVIIEGNGCEWDRFSCCSKDEFKCITKHLDHCGRWTRKRVFLESRGQLKFNGNLCRCRVQMQKMLIFISRIILKGWWTGFHWSTDNDHENRPNWKQF